MDPESESNTAVCDDEEGMLGRQEEATREVTEARQEWGNISQRRPPRIMTAGLGGAGKSTLVNQLFGKEENVAEEGTGYSGKATTTVIGCYCHKMQNDVEAVIFDTPGFNDSSIDEFRIIAEMKVKTETELDLFLYCISVETRGARVTSADVRAIRLLTHTFGVSLWKNAIFVITFANEACRRLEKQQYLELTHTIEVELKMHLEKLGVPEASQVPVVTAGHKDLKIHPHEDEEWLKRLFGLCVLRIKSSAVTALLKGRLTKTQFCMIIGGVGGVGAVGGILAALFGPLGLGILAAIGAGGGGGFVVGGAGTAGVMWKIESIRDQLKVMWQERKVAKIAKKQ